ncbi:prephenate dehydratase [Candidatus Margulisiibacteriota bacterium]
MKVGYLGPEGTFSEEAGALYKKKIGKAKFIPYSSIHALLKAVDRGSVHEGVVPIENSVEGTIGVVSDMLVNDVDLKITQELILPVKHHLLTKKKVPLGKITDVISHPQAIDQCKHYLRKKLPKVQIHFAYSTAEAARSVAEVVEVDLKGSKKRDIFAAIGTLAAAKLYKLAIVDKEINDYKDNMTRFLALSKKDHPPTGNDKTSIVFSTLRDHPGGLHNILGEFAMRGINLTKIESRPTKRTLGDYFFFIDLQGHRTDPVVLEALEDIKKKASFVKILGSYPKAG